MFSARFFRSIVVTEDGALDVAAEIAKDGETLWLRKLSIFPADPDREFIAVGVGA